MPSASALRQTFPGSSAIAAASYEPVDERSGTLTITFKGGRSYDYPDVPPEVWEGLQGSSSPGTYWRTSIKDVYG